MGNLKDTFRKHKGKISMVISVLLVIGIAIGLYFIINKGQKNMAEEQQLVDKNYRLADHIITGNDIGFIRMLNPKNGKEVSNIDLKGNTDSRYIYSVNKDLDKVSVYGTFENAFYEVTADKTKLNSHKRIELKNAMEFDTFKGEGDYIVTLSKDRKILNKIDKDGNIKEYKVDEEVNDYIIADNILVFTTSNHIHKIGLTNDERSKIEIGDKTLGIFAVQGELIAFNKFGSGLKQSIVLKLNPKDLYIKSMQKIDVPGIEPITPDSDDKNLVYSEVINVDTNPRQIITLLNEDNLNKETTNIKLPIKVSELKYNKENSIASKGYMYTHKGNMLEIVDIRSQQLSNSIEVGEIFVVPIIK